MIEDLRGRVDYDECGQGPTIVFLPGSCSTGAAWRPVIAALNGRFRCVTTSLLGYGGTQERRSASDPSMAHELDVAELVIRKAGGPVHLVGHSFGGLVALAVALRHRVPLASLAVLEAPLVELLGGNGEHLHYAAFRRMTDGYFADFAGGNAAAIGTMIDFYGGDGTFAAWPPRVRAYAMETTAVNIRDWQSIYRFPLATAALAAVEIPTLVAWGGASHPAVRRANALLGESLPRAVVAPLDGAAHFMISTHAEQVGHLIAAHIGAADAAGPSETPMRAAS
ncbi:MAG: alpha/beta fold hydrolase [Reyranellaceae bacterium]